MRVQTHPQHFNPHLLLLLKLNTEEESQDTSSTFQSSPSDIIKSKHSRKESRHLQHLNPHPSVWVLHHAVLGVSTMQSSVLHHILLGVSNALGTG